MDFCLSDHAIMTCRLQKAGERSGSMERLPHPEFAISRKWKRVLKDVEDRRDSDLPQMGTSDLHIKKN
jgi:hypothetical protein